MEGKDTNNEMKDLLQSSFDNFEVQADPEVWEAIEKEIVPVKKIGFAWWSYAAAASVAVILATGAIWFLNPAPEMEFTAEQAPKATTKNNNEVNTIRSPLEEDNEPIIQPAKDINSTQEERIEIASVSEKTDEPLKNTASLDKEPGFSEPAKNAVAISTPRASATLREKNNNQPEETSGINSSESAENKSDALPKSNAVAVIHDNERESIDEEPNDASNQSDINQAEKNIADPGIATSNPLGKEHLDKTVASSENPQEATPQKEGTKETLAEAPIALQAETPENEKKVTEEAPVIKPEDIDIGMKIEPQPPNPFKEWFLAANAQSSQGSEEASSRFLKSEEVEKQPFASVDVANSTISQPGNVVFDERKFEPPIRTSVTLNYAFNERWSFESGLSYSQLNSSRISTEESEINVRQKDQLHYLGLPILLNYNLVVNGRFSAFLSGGLIVEKGLSHVSKIVVQEYDEITNERSIDRINGIKYAFITGLGLEYKMNDLIGIFIQPSLTFFNATETQPFDIGGSQTSGSQASLRFGMRFHMNKIQTK